MKRYISIILIFNIALVVRAQSVLSFGARGGLEFPLPKCGQPAKAESGWAGVFDIGYTYYRSTYSSGDWGIHTGASFGYAQNHTLLDFSQQYSNYDYLRHEMLYTTSGSVNADLQRLYVEVPVMGAFRYKGFVAQIGMKAQCAVWSKSNQTLDNPVIDAYYVSYAVHVTDELITGLASSGDLQKSYADVAPRMNILAAARIGGEFMVGRSGLMGIMVYIDYNVWNTSPYKSSRTLIAVAPITDAAYPVPAVTVNSAFTSLISRINPLQAGITLYYAIDFSSLK